MARKPKGSTGRTRRSADDAPGSRAGSAGAGAAPLARRGDTAGIKRHEDLPARIDPYAWLRDENWREVMREPEKLLPEIRTHLEAENAYTSAKLEQITQALQDRLFDEMRGRIKENDSTVPAIDGPWAYYRRFREGGEYPLFARRPSANAFDGELKHEQLLIDGDELAKGKAFFDVRKVSHSPDHKFIAYAIDEKGSEFYTIHVRDMASGKDVDVIEHTYGDFVWAEDSHAIYWVARDGNARPVSVHLRTVGKVGDPTIYEETDPGFFVGVQKSESRKFIFVTANDHTTTEWRYLRTDEPTPKLKLIAERERGVDYSVVDFNDRFLIRANRDGAVDFGLWTVSYDAPDASHWTVDVPHRPGTLILYVEAYQDFLVRMERENGLPRLVVRNRATRAEHVIDFPEAAYALAMTSGEEWASPVLRFEYSSPSTPAQTFDYDMATRTRTLRKTQEVPSGHNPANYVVERIDAPAEDGALIPVTLLRHKDTMIDGTAPVLLYGYGSYGITIPADFRTARLSLVDRGFIYAVADVRGSMAKGYQWYLDGKLEKKTNTFKDYVAAGRYLVAKGYTRPRLIVGMGGSAGGMLMGVAANLDPSLFGGIIAAAPFVDVLNTMSDETLPLTPPEWPEWGNPLTDRDAYLRIASYSPYENVAERDYPPMLITGGLTDPRVTYWEPTKWAARLRHEAPNAGPYFLRINMDAGHSGVSGRFASLRETALEYAFALAAVGRGGASVTLSS